MAPGQKPNVAATMSKQPSMDVFFRRRQGFAVVALGLGKRKTGTVNDGRQAWREVFAPGVRLLPFYVMLFHYIKSDKSNYGTWLCSSMGSFLHTAHFSSPE